MMYKSFLLLATASTLALAACAGDSGSTSMAASTTPAPAHSAMTAPAAPGVLATTTLPTNSVQGTLPPAADLLNAPMSTVSKTSDVESRLTHLETDIEVMKGQIQLVRPLLEKMPALQDKLSELVAELQRIDARVASTKGNAADMPDVKGEKEIKLEKAYRVETTHAAPMAPVVKPVPKMSPIISPAPKKSTSSAAPVHKKEAMMTTSDSSKKSTAAPSDSMADISAITPASTVSSPALTPAASATTSESKGLMAVRVGDDSEKTRVVLDVVGGAVFQYDLDNAEKILIIDLNTPVANASMGEFDKSPLVASYSTQAISPEKSRVILQLRTPIDVLKTSTLPPNDDKPDRVILDLVPATR